MHREAACVSFYYFKYFLFVVIDNSNEDTVMLHKRTTKGINDIRDRAPSRERINLSLRINNLKGKKGEAA